LASPELVRQQVTNADRTSAVALGRKLGQPPPHRLVEVQAPVVDERHRGSRGDQLGHREPQVQCVDPRCRAAGEVGQPARGQPALPVAGHHRDRNAGNGPSNGLLDGRPQRLVRRAVRVFRSGRHQAGDRTAAPHSIAARTIRGARRKRKGREGEPRTPAQ
jgi:hypothetical protein